MPAADLNPQPRAWPRCGECKTAYVLRHAVVFDFHRKRGRIAMEWVWQRDCKHRKAAPEAAGTTRIKAKRRRSK